jgi:hypothetical protein
VAWCDTVSIAIGVIDVIMMIAVGATMVYYKKQTQCDACLGSRSHHELEEEEEGMEAADITSFTNPTLDPATANTAPHVNIEMTSTNHSSSGSEIPDDWDAHETEEGVAFYVQRGSGLTQWDKPTSSSSSTSSSPQHHTRDSTKLPPNWDKYKSEEGQRFYVNNDTSESSWVPPEGSIGGSASARGESVPAYSNPMKRTKAKNTAPTAASKTKHHARNSTKLPPDWNKYNDDEGQRYYSNGKTQETSWDAPEGSTGGSTNK